MILDHVAIGVSDLAVAKAFYEQALQPLGAFVLDPDGHNVEAVIHDAG